MKATKSKTKNQNEAEYTVVNPKDAKEIVCLVDEKYYVNNFFNMEYWDYKEGQAFDTAGSIYASRFLREYKKKHVILQLIIDNLRVYEKASISLELLTKAFEGAIKDGDLRLLIHKGVKYICSKDVERDAIKYHNNLELDVDGSSLKLMLQEEHAMRILQII